MARPFADWCQLAMDPEGFVLAAFPWDQPGGVLQDRTLERWQQEFLRSVGKGLLTPEQAIRQASVSGNGVGKSTLVSWIILWALCTAADTRGVVTANTETQLKTKTWAELGKWYNLLDPVLRDSLKLTATALFVRDESHERTWRIDMV